MEDRAHNEGRLALLWAVGLPLAIVTATLTLSGAIFGSVPYDGHSTRDPFAPLLLVAGFGLPSALIARVLNKRGSWLYYALAGAVAGIIGFSILIVVLIWAEGGRHILTIIAELTWTKVATLALHLPAMAWPGAIAGLAGGAIFGAFASWADR